MKKILWKLISKGTLKRSVIPSFNLKSLRLTFAYKWHLTPNECNLHPLFFEFLFSYLFFFSGKWENYYIIKSFKICRHFFKFWISIASNGDKNIIVIKSFEFFSISTICRLFPKSNISYVGNRFLLKTLADT